jgi:type I restriction enzyme, S subunit
VILDRDDAPDGWAIAKLGEVVQLSRERVEPSEVADAPYLSLEHIESGSCRILGHGSASEVRSTKSVFKPGDVLYGKLRPYLNKVCRPDFAGVCSTDILVFPPAEHLDSSYLMRFLSTPQVVKYANHNSAGVQLPRVSFSALAELDFPLPPLAEQKRIVAKVEALLARVNAARERLARVPAILKRFRQSILAAACSGHLTTTWRDDHPDVVAAPRLLERLRVMRQRTLRNGRDRERVWLGAAAGRPASRPNPDFEAEIPESWTVASIDELATHITSGSRDWKRYYRANAPGTFIMAQNVRPLLFDRSYRLAVDPPLNDRDRIRSQAKKGDILVTIVGANTGDVCRIAEPVDQHYVCQSVALIRPVLLETSSFIELYLNSPHHGRRQYEDWMYGEGRPHLSFDHLRATAIALPPIEEQAEIVRRVQDLFGLADAIEGRMMAGVARTEKLTWAILAKAFRGELVPTEADLARAEGRPYEPASALLERSRTAEYATVASLSVSVRRRKKKS